MGITYSIISSLSEENRRLSREYEELSFRKQCMEERRLARQDYIKLVENYNRACLQWQEQVNDLIKTAVRNGTPFKEVMENLHYYTNDLPRPQLIKENNQNQIGWK